MTTLTAPKVLGDLREGPLLGVEVADVDGPSADVAVAAEPGGVGVDAVGGQVEQGYPDGYFDIYIGDAFERVITDQLDFLARHVPTS
jgi:hypothetical protein